MILLGMAMRDVCISERNVRFEVAELINLPFEERQKRVSIDEEKNR